MLDRKKPDWMIHGVVEEDKVVYHTHGLEKHGSLELELNLSLPEKDAALYLNIIGSEIASERKFKDGDVADDLFSVPVAFREVEGVHGEGQKNLRVIFPDAQSKFPWDEGCDPNYANQI